MKIKSLLLTVLFATLLTGCGTEYQLAKAFQEQSQRTMVAVYFPEAAQVTLIQDSDGSYTDVLDSVNQDAFLDIMYAAYAEELGRYGLEVYLPSDPDAVQVDSVHWLVVLSKVEIQGLFTTYVDHLYDLVNEYDYPFSLNTVNVASWFDINDGDWKPTLYYEHNLRDGFESHVSGSQYHYEITPLKKEDVYNYAVFLGRRCAAYTYDDLLNRYVAAELKKSGKQPRFQIHWDPASKSYVFLEENEGFVELKE